MNTAFIFLMAGIMAAGGAPATDRISNQTYDGADEAPLREIAAYEGERMLDGSEHIRDCVYLNVDENGTVRVVKKDRDEVKDGTDTREEDGMTYPMIDREKKPIAAPKPIMQKKDAFTVNVVVCESFSIERICIPQPQEEYDVK